MKNKILVFLSIFILINLFSFSFAEAIPTEVTLNKSINITYNGDLQIFKNASGVEVFPISYNGTTYLPIRSISSLFNMGIKWDGNTQSIYLGEGDIDTVASAKASSGRNLQAEKISAKINKDIKIYYNNQALAFSDANGTQVFPISYNGTTYLPVRAISNVFGADISWDGATQTVKILKLETVGKPTVDGNEFSMGSWNGNIYTNPYLGIKLTMPAGWQKISDNTWEQAFNQGTEILGKDGYDANELKQLKEQNVVMFASISSSTGSNIQLIREKNVNNVSEEEYMKSIKEGLLAITQIKYNIGDIKTSTIAGQNYTTIEASATYLGINIKQVYYLRKIDDSFFYIIVTDVGNEVNINNFIEKN